MLAAAQPSLATLNTQNFPPLKSTNTIYKKKTELFAVNYNTQFRFFLFLRKPREFLPVKIRFYTLFISFFASSFFRRSASSSTSSSSSSSRLSFSQEILLIATLRRFGCTYTSENWKFPSFSLVPKLCHTFQLAISVEKRR